MWLQFFLSLGLFLLILVIPGFCFFRLLKAPCLDAVLLSPAFSVSLYSVLGILYGLVGVTSSAFSVFVVPSVLLVGCLFAKMAKVGVVANVGLKRGFCDFCSRGSRACGMRPGLVSLSAPAAEPLACGRIILFYLLCGIIAGAVLFLKPLNGADAFISTYDNLYHYNALRALVESGYWSPLGTSCYLALPDGLNPLPGGTYPLDGYYPLGWHVLVALLMELSGCALTVAVNVANFTFVSVVFPLGMCALMSCLFKKESTIAAGALCSCVCAAFPWYLLVEWPLFPNLSAFCLIPLLATCFIRWAEAVAAHIASTEGNDACHPLAVWIVAFLFSCIACATIHPNSIFTAVLLLASFVVWLPSWALGKRFGAVAGVAAAVAIGVIVALAWVQLAGADAFEYVMDEAIKARQLPEEAWLGVIEFSFMSKAGQPLFSMLVLAGAIALLVSRRNCWLIASLVLAVIVYVASASFEEGPIRQILTGFWYSEPKRIGCIVGLAAIPVASCGLAALYEGAAALIIHAFGLRSDERVKALGSCANENGDWEKAEQRVRAGLAAAFTLVFVGVVFCVPYAAPVDSGDLEQNAETQDSDVHRGSALQRIAKLAEDNYANPILSREEVAFMERAAKTIGPEDAVINLPYDGSIVAYGIAGLKSYYLERYGYQGEHETPESALIRTELSDVSTRADVLAAVQSTGCRYVLILKRDKEDIVYNFDKSLWLGISGISDETPGFTPVLSEGDMRLYRIDAA